jgi:hypothetical protein
MGDIEDASIRRLYFTVVSVFLLNQSMLRSALFFFLMKNVPFQTKKVRALMRYTVADITSYGYNHRTNTLLACCTSFREILGGSRSRLMLQQQCPIIELE